MASPIFNVTRRSFVIASCGLLLPRPGWAAITPRPLLHWPLDDPKAAGRERMTGTLATIVDGTGRLEWVGNGKATLPRFDGYSVWMDHELDTPLKLERELALSAWVALESFPVTTASILEWNKESSSVQFAVNRLGFVLAAIQVNGQKFECRSEHPIAVGRWQHLAAILAHDGMIVLFVDGKEVSRMQVRSDISTVGNISTVLIGRGAADDVVAKVFATNVLNGLIREVQVYDSALTPRDIQALSQEFQPTEAQAAFPMAWCRNSFFCSVGRNWKTRATARRRTFGSALSRFAPARKSAQIISKQ